MTMGRTPMTKDFSAAAPSSAKPPVIIRRDDFVKLAAVAERVAQGSAAAELVDLVRALEAERRAQEWEAEDATIALGVYAGDERGYFRWWNVEREIRIKPGMPAWRLLWQDGTQEIAVFDHPPVSADQMARLEHLGIATLQSTYPKGAPFRFLQVNDPNMGHAIRGPFLRADSASGPPGGAWIVSGPDSGRVAWAKNSFDARFMASCVNMAIELEQEVARYGSGDYSFPKEIEKSGLRGVIRRLRQSIEPQERWENEPPEALRAMGVELERLLLEFLAASRTFRFGKPFRDRT